MVEKGVGQSVRVGVPVCSMMMQLFGEQEVGRLKMKCFISGKC